jgi:frataxin-like iron-binding protein CyaY
VYTITVSRQDRPETVYPLVRDYEVKGGVLTLAFDDHHDLVIPLYQVVTVDIQKQG